MAETKIDKKERKTLTPTWVGEPVQLPNSQVKVLRFNADDGLQYETFKASLFPYIQVGQLVDADTELRITTTDEGTQYPHWRIVQIYKDGKPISSDKGQQQYRGRDEDRTDVRTAILEIGQTYRAGLYKETDSEVKAYKRWLRNMIIGEKQDETAQPIPKPIEKKQPKIEPQEKGEVGIELTATTEPQSFAQLRSWVIGHGKEFTLSWLINSLKIPEAELRTDPNGSYHKIKDKMKWKD